MKQRNGEQVVDRFRSNEVNGVVVVLNFEDFFFFL